MRNTHKTIQILNRIEGKTWEARFWCAECQRSTFIYGTAPKKMKTDATLCSRCHQSAYLVDEYQIGED
jgi:transcription elongation factor Elf1